MKLGWDIARRLLTVCLIVVAGTLLTATMVRLAPGFDVDEQQLDSRLSHESRDALRLQRGQNSEILNFYRSFLLNAAHGDFGNSVTLNRPVRELVSERLPVTLGLVGWGLITAWIVAISFGCAAALLRQTPYDAVTAVFASFLLCVPAATIAVLAMVLHVPAAIALALIVFPRLFRYMRNLLIRSYRMPHVVTARAKGLGPIAVLIWHIVPVCAAPLIALAAVSVSIGLGASVAVEALCGVPGIGQLAWQAALGRDLPLLIALTMLVTVLTLLANAVSDVFQGGMAHANS